MVKEKSNGYKIAFLLLLLSSSSCLVGALECYKSYQHILNYTVTSATLPSFNESEIVSNDECWVEIVWYENPSFSVLILYGKGTSARDDFGRDELFVDIQLFLEPFQTTIESEHSLKYRCASANLCNNEVTMKNLLNSLVLEERFTKEFYTLIQAEKFDNKTAATCFRFTIIPSTCEMPDLESCTR
jgi:hypothetical protein